MSRKGPRGLLHESFDKCVMFHLLTVFPNNAAEQEKLEPRSRLPRKSVLRSLASCARNLGPHILRTSPKIVASRRKT
jgi:hypothetical protein